MIGACRAALSESGRRFVAFILLLTLAFASALASELTVLRVPFERDGLLGNLDDAYLHSPWFEPVLVPGPRGDALSFDGYSTWIEGYRQPQNLPLDISLGFSVASWPPSGTHLLALADETSLTIELNRWGYVRARLASAGHEVAVATHQPISLQEWHSLHLSVGPDELTLGIDGVNASRSLPEPLRTSSLGGTVVIGRDAEAPLVDGTYPTGVLHGLIDDLRVGRQVTEREPFAARAPRPGASSERFDNDPHRPRYHPMPPAGWTNEPHGLSRVDGRWHLFYQANPSGPWWDQMHWGHLESTDLVQWRARAPALWPTPGFDRAGVWVGDVVQHEGKAAAVYSGVNGQWAGVGVAFSDSADPTVFVKSRKNPVLVDTPHGFQDMRDPFLLRQADEWLMLIGSGRQAAPQRPTILRYRSTDLQHWRFEGELDVGSIERFGSYWELPKLLDLGERWVLVVTTVKAGTAARTQYWIGSWDGTRFRADDPVPRLLDLFTTHLAHTFAPLDESSFVAIGVIPEEHRTGVERLEAGWIHGFGLPREVFLCKDNTRLCQQPLAASSSLFGAPRTIPPITVGTEWQRVNRADEDASVARLSLTFDSLPAAPVEIALRADEQLDEATVLRYFPGSGRLALDFRRSSRTPTARKDVLWARLAEPAEVLGLSIHVDRSFITVFTDAGESFGFRTFPVGEHADNVLVRAMRQGQVEIDATFAPFLAPD